MVGVGVEMVGVKIAAGGWQQESDRCSAKPHQPGSAPGLHPARTTLKSTPSI